MVYGPFEAAFCQAEKVITDECSLPTISPRKTTTVTVINLGRQLRRLDCDQRPPRVSLVLSVTASKRNVVFHGES